MRKVILIILGILLLSGLAAASPTAYFSYDVGEGGAPLTVHFSDLSTGGTVSSWVWNFGDGNTSSTQSPTHTYYSVGTYTVTLTINGGVSTATGYHIITVTTIPTANFAVSTQAGVAPLAVNFSDLSTGVPTSWSWNFGDGGTSTQQNPSHWYNSTGTYTVSLTALDASSQGSTKTVSQCIIVTQTATMPDASFTVNPTTGQAPATISFTDTSSGSPISWSWDFGDGGASTAKNPSHVYQNPGLYTVTLTVNNGYGTDMYTASSAVAVSGVSSIITAGLHANFNAVASTNSSLPIPVVFQDTSTGNPVNWSWSFGDGTNSTEQNPTHTYNDTKTYLVTLYIMNATGTSSICAWNITPAIAAPRNYSQYITKIFTPKMTTWDFVANTASFYTTFIPPDIFWAVILLLPFITIYNRTNTFLLVAVLYLMSGGIIATVMPPSLAPFAFWFVIIGVGGILYKLFVTD